MALCLLCHERLPDYEVIDHLRLLHPDRYEAPLLWPDGELVIIDLTELEDENGSLLVSETRHEHRWELSEGAGGGWFCACGAWDDFIWFYKGPGERHEHEDDAEHEHPGGRTPHTHPLGSFS